jgi:putative addiction module component (TIGR02574 family)
MMSVGGGMILAGIRTSEVSRMTIDELKREALLLDPSNRANLARELLGSLDDLPAEDVERLWLEEAERRRVEAQAGKVAPLPMDEVFAQARAARG